VPQWDPYAMKVNHGDRNCYNCGGFGYIARHCKNKRTEDRIKEEKRLEYRGNGNNEERKMIEGRNGQNNSLNGDGDLIVLN